jgi:hypothetical protein
MDKTSARGSENRANIRNTIVQLLRSGPKKARFVTELSASLRRSKVKFTDLEEVLSVLEAEGRVIIRDHFCADPHVAGVDLRIVALVEDSEGADPELTAIHRVDETWNKWLSAYLANHRCG